MGFGRIFVCQRSAFEVGNGMRAGGIYQLEISIISSFDSIKQCRGGC